MPTCFRLVLKACRATTLLPVFFPAMSSSIFSATAALPPVHKGWRIAQVLVWLLGVGQHHQDGLLMDLQGVIPSWVPVLIAKLVVAFFMWWLLLLKPNKKAGSQGQHL